MIKFCSLIDSGGGRSHKILRKLMLEFHNADPGSSLRFNRQNEYEYPPITGVQEHIAYRKNFEEVLQLPLYAENQKQLNASFSWIGHFEFFNADVISFYLYASNFDKHFKNPSIFQVEPFNPPVLPDKSDKDAKQVSLATISLDFLRHLHEQENLFMQNCGHLITT